MSKKSSLVYAKSSSDSTNLSRCSLLQQALDLTKIVTAEDNHVYEEFFGRDDKPYRLLSYLDKIREASLAALKEGSGHPFKASAA